MLLNSFHTLLLNISHSHPTPPLPNTQSLDQKGKRASSYGEGLACFCWIGRLASAFQLISAQLNPTLSTLQMPMPPLCLTEQEAAGENRAPGVAGRPVNSGPLTSSRPSVLPNSSMFSGSIHSVILLHDYFPPLPLGLILSLSHWMEAIPISLRKQKPTEENFCNLLPTCAPT